MHLLCNMWFLWLFGNNVEDRLGPLLYLFLYLLGGLIASGVHWAVDPDSTMPIIGASGAIAAVLGAYAVTWPWARVSTLVFLVVFVTIIDVPALGGARRVVPRPGVVGQESLRRRGVGRGGLVGPRRRLLGRHGADAAVERAMDGETRQGQDPIGE